MNGAATLVKKLDAEDVNSSMILLPDYQQSSSLPQGSSYTTSNAAAPYIPQSVIQQSQLSTSCSPAAVSTIHSYFGPSRGVSAGGTTPVLISSINGPDAQIGMLTPTGGQSSIMGGGRLFSTSQQGGSALFTGGGNTARSTTSGSRIISERVVEHSVRVPKRVTREDIFEKVIVVPERVVHEEVVEDVQTVREKIVEIAVPVVSERVVEVPEIEYIERVVEVPEVIVREKIREVPKVEVRERIIEIPKIYTQERIVEVPDIEYREVPVEKIVEVPEIREQVVIKEVPVPQYVEKPIPEYVDVHEEQEVVRHIPVAVEAVTTCEFKLPRLRPHYTLVDIPLYVPRFVEVAVPQDMMHPAAVAQADLHIQKFNQLTSQAAVSLSEVEALAHEIKSANYDELLLANVPRDKQQRMAANFIVENWMNGKLQIDPASMVCATAEKPDPFKIGASLSTTKTGPAADIPVVEDGPHQPTGEEPCQGTTTTSKDENLALMHVSAVLRDGTPVVSGVYSTM